MSTLRKFKTSKIDTLYIHPQIQTSDSLFNQNCLAIIKYSMNIPPMVIFCCSTKLNHSCKYVAPKIQIEPGGRHLPLIRKNGKLTKIYVKPSVKSVRKKTSENRCFSV